MAIIHRISGQLVDICTPSLMKITPDGELQIHIIAHAEFCINVRTAPEEGEMSRIEHSRDVIGISQDAATCSLVKKWSANAIMWIIPTQRSGYV